MGRALKTWWEQIEPWYFVVGLANVVLGASSVLIPLTVAKLLGRTAGSVGLLAAMVSLVGVIGSLIWGRLSDAAHRRKPFIVLGYAAVGLSFVGIAFAKSFQQLAILNMLLNFFWVANASVTVLIVIENREASDWEGKISQLNQLGAVGWVTGLALGGLWMQFASTFLGEFGAIRSLFGLMGVAGLAASLLAARYVPRTRPVFTERKFRGILLAMGSFISERARFSPLHLYHRLRPGRLIQLLRQPGGFRSGTKRFFISTLISYLGLGFFGIPLPLLLAQKLGLSSSIVFFLFMIQHAGIVLAYPFASRRIRRYGNRRVQISALRTRAMLFGGFAALVALPGLNLPLPWLVVAFVIYGISWSYFQLSGIALTSRLAKEENRGLSLGVYNATAGLGWILAGLGSGICADTLGYAATFAIGVGLLCVSLIVLRFVPDPVPEFMHNEREVEDQYAMAHRIMPSQILSPDTANLRLRSAGLRSYSR